MKTSKFQAIDLEKYLVVLQFYTQKFRKYVLKQHEKTWTDRSLQDGIIAGLGQPDN